MIMQGPPHLPSRAVRKQTILCRPMPSPSSSPVRNLGAESSRLATFLLILSLASIMLGRLTVEVGSLMLSIERALGLLLVIPMLAALLTSTRIDERMSIVWLWLFWCVSSTISALLSGAFAAHIPTLILTILPVSFFWLFSSRSIDPLLINLWARRILWVNAVAGVTVVALQSVSFVRELALLDDANRLYLLAREPNLFGSGTAFLICLTFSRARFDFATVALYGISLGVLLASFSKMPLIAFGAALPLYLLLRAMVKRTGGVIAVVLPIWSALIGAIGLFTFLPQAQTLYTTALERSDSIYSRTYLLKLALARYEDSPIWGRGPGDFGLQGIVVLKRLGTDDEGNLWIWQMFVNILHDSGVVGLIVYCLVLFAILRTGMKLIRAGSLDHCAYMCAFVVVLLSSQASSLHLSAIFGIAAGLTVSRLTPTRRGRQLPPSGSRRFKPAFVAP